MSGKKSFKDGLSPVLNPALQFISPPAAAPAPAQDAPDETVQPEASAPAPDQGPTQRPAPDGGNPQEAPQPAGKPPAGFKVNPLYVETRSHRLQVLIQPSLFKKIKAKAKASRKSVNDYIHAALDKATGGEGGPDA
jgi:hypothetical protein